MSEVLGRFLDVGASIGEVTRADRTETLRAVPSMLSFKGPVAVLISSLSASAAEVSASALRFYGRAKLFGSQTPGNVLLSNNFRLADGGIVQVAVADMRGPDGRRLENVGVKPDYEIMPTLETVRAGRDVVLEAALADLAQTTH
jgi:carboxyl-terminal processing protease